MPYRARLLFRGSAFALTGVLVLVLAPLSVALSANTNDITTLGSAIAYQRDAQGRSFPVDLGGAAGGSGVAGRLGLHVSAGELAIWRDRWVNGVSGDSFLHARVNEERSRVNGYANTFDSNPDSSLWDWDGLERSNGTVEGGRGTIDQSQRPAAARMQAAAFRALLEKDASLMRKVRDTLVRQPDRRDMDFTHSQWDGSKSGSGNMRSAYDPGFRISHVMVSQLMTYDYVKIAAAEGWGPDFSSSNDRKMRDWFMGFADYVIESPRDRMDENFPNWRRGDYNTLAGRATSSSNLLTNSGGPDTYQGGPKVHQVHERWNNRGNAMIRFVGLAGIVFDERDHRDFAAEWFRSMIRFGVYPHGTWGDMVRGNENSGMSPGLGYPARQYTHGMNFADALARTGDTSVIGFRTTEGLYDSKGAPSSFGNPESHKSWEFFAQTLTRYSDGTYSRRNKNGSRFDWNAAGIGRSEQLVHGNLYFQNPKVRDFYRGQNGMHFGITSGFTNQNDSGAFPAPYLKWAGLEGKVWPYPKQ